MLISANIICFSFLKETDDTFRAVREKQQIRREMPPEVLEHMARVYDLPHGASPAYGMRNLHLHDIEVDMALCKTLSVEELMKRANEYSLSESVSSPGGPVELLDSLQKAAQAEKVQKDLTRRSRSSASSRPELK